MKEPLTSENLYESTRDGHSPILLDASEVPGMIAALKIKEALERELVEFRQLVESVEGRLVRVSSEENWRIVGLLCEKRDAYKEEIRKIESHLKEGL